MSWILTVVFLTGIISIVESGNNAFQLTSNGYEDLVVSVNKKCDGDFSQSEATNLLDNLQNIITEGNARLHYATNNRALIYKVIVLLPRDFPPVEGRTYLTDSRVSYSSASIIVDTLNPLMGHSPYTIQPRGCGEEGDYIHYTHEYMTGSIDMNHYDGDPGKKFAREFSKLRWGLFNESSNSNDRLLGNPYYKDSDNNFEGVRCPFALQGDLVDENGEQCTHLEDCVRFNPKFNQDTTADFASILSHHQHDSVVKFCSNDPSEPETLHNSDAGNQHNDMCGRRSAWEIMNQHEDFTERNTIYQLQEPTFEYYQPSRRTIVLILDVSGSMSNSAENLHQAASLFIENTRYNCHKIGIIRFNSIATIVQDIMPVDTRQDKDTLLNLIPRESDGGTCIGCGIILGIQMLQDEGITAGGNLIVLTDGEENDDATHHISTIGPQVQTQGVTIDGILYGDNVDITHPLHTLVVDTGGKAILASNDDSLKFNADFIELAAERACDVNGHIEILLSTTELVTQSQRGGGVFYNDASIDETIQFVITTKFDDQTLQDVVVEVHTPDGFVSRSDTDAQWIIATDNKSMKWRIQVNDKTGMWSYWINNNNPSTTEFYVIVTGAGETASCDTVPVLITPYYASTIDLNDVNGSDPRMQIAALAVRGRTPLLDATVIASVTPTGGSRVEIVLKDDGQDPDTVPDDGIYAALFNGITQDGTYDVELSFEQITSSRRKRSPTMRSMLFDNTQDSGPIKRVQQSGFFEIKNAASSGFLDKQDPYAPSRITNLIATENTLEFTAVGDDHNTGTADHYVIKVSSSSARELIDNFDSQQTVIEMAMVEPYTMNVDAGEYVVLNLTIPDELDGIPFFYAAVAYDEAGNTSPISNIAQLGVNAKSARNVRIVDTVSTAEPSPTDTSSDVAATFSNSVYCVCIFGLTVLFMLV